MNTCMSTCQLEISIKYFVTIIIDGDVVLEAIAFASRHVELPRRRLLLHDGYSNLPQNENSDFDNFFDRPSWTAELPFTL